MDYEQLKGLLSAQPDEAEQRMAKMQGLLGLGIGLLSGSRGNYGAFAPALAQGLQGGMQGFMGAQQMGQQNRRSKAQEAIALANLQSQMSGNRIREQEAADRADDRRRRLTWEESVARVTQPPAPMPMPVQGSMGGLDSYDPPNAAPTPAPNLTPAQLRALGMQGLPYGGAQLLGQADRMEAQNRPTMMEATRVNPETGQRERVAMPVMPGQTTVLGDVQRRTAQRDMGDRVETIDADTGAVISSAPKGLAPQPPRQGPAPQYALAPDPRSPTGYSYQVIQAGLPGAAPRDPNAPKPTTVPVGTGDAIREARELLTGIRIGPDGRPTQIPGSAKPTASGAGSLLDAGMNFFGASTPSANTAAQLRVVAGRLVGSVPRFEGPQSNLDVELYKQAAADVGNASKPIAQRVAALKTMEDLIAKYEPGYTGPRQPAQPAPSNPQVDAINAAAGGLPPVGAIEQELARRQRGGNGRGGAGGTF